MKEETDNPKLTDLPRLTTALVRWRRGGKTIVFTNGCFDVIHVGHVRYLKMARKLGDVLVVGLNSDASVRTLKGAGRPVQTLAERAEVLGAFPFITRIVAFEEESVEGLVRVVRPDVLVKGGDYRKSEVVGGKFVARYGGKVIVLGLVPGRSTSAILAKLG